MLKAAVGQIRMAPRPACVVLFLVAVGAPGTGAAWGHLRDIDVEPRDARHLSFIVLARHEIDFCIAIDPGERENYSAASLEAQTRMALDLWLAPVRPVVGEVAVRRLQCDDAQLNLKVDLGPDADNPHLSGHAFMQSDAAGDPAPAYEVVKLNTRYTSASDGAKSSLNDFAQVAHKVQGGRWSLEALMKRISLETPMTVGEFSEWARIPYGVAFNSTYPLILHELGHSFGLCDTYQNSSDAGISNCSDEHASVSSAERQPFSIMQSWRVFYLTPDDRDGIRALFRRFADDRSRFGPDPAPGDLQRQPFDAR